MSSAKGTLITALDVGSTKICCFVGRVDEEGDIKVEGIGHQVSEGIKSGAVVDLAAVESSIRAAADAAERMAGETIRRVFINVSTGLPESEAIHVEVKIAGHQVGDNDIRRALEEARRQAERPEREVLHTIPITYSIDGSRGIDDPRGMYGDRLGVDIHVVTAATGPLRNLQLCMDTGHLGVAGMCASAFASGLSCLVEDERDMGVTLIDMGGGTTSVAVFLEGALVYTDVVPIGGQHVTNDIARGLLTSVVDAERLKTLFGSALRSASDDHEMITLVQVGETPGDEQTQTLPRSMLTGIIQPRVEEILESVHERLISSGFDQAVGKRVVLTGGASQLQGVRELAARILNKQVRLGKPLDVEGLAEATVGPAFATCAGLLAYAAQGVARKGPLTAAMLVPEEPRNAMARVGRWFRENF